MLERRSPLEGLPAFAGDGVSLREVPDFTLTQVAGKVAALKTALGTVPKSVGLAWSSDGAALLAVGPNQVWFIEDPATFQVSSSSRKRGPSLSSSESGAKLGPRLRGDDVREDVFITPLSSSRSRFALEGSRSRELLSKCAALDFHSKAFTPGKFAMTGIHHTPVLIHCVEANAFHIYVMRTFARSIWEVFDDAAHT